MSPSALKEEPREARSADSTALAYLSATRLKTWQECRLKWYFRYIERIEVPATPPQFVGRLVHRVLQEYNLNRWRGQPASPDDLHPVFTELWPDQPEGLDWEGKEALCRHQAWQILEHYIANTPMPPDEKPEAVEVAVERDLEAYGLPPLKGVIDLVRGGGVIVDFKTSARSPDPLLAGHLHQTQLGCYALLYREATGRTEGGFELHHLVKTREPKLVVTAMQPLDRNQIGQLVRLMESYVNGVESEDYLVPSPGQHCAWCDYLPQCRTWRGTE